MADKKATIVIKKLKKGGHAGHHGGAWKVAYADFVTAMMCFFLVMWLMGADESTKASIAAYFNNPSQEESVDTPDPGQIPLGDQVGAGDSILRGAQGQVPEDLVRRPQALRGRGPDSTGPTDSQGALSKEDLIAAESLIFVIKGSQLFAENSTDLLNQDAERALSSIQRVAKNFRGKLSIRTLNQNSERHGYEFQMSRLIRIKEKIVDQRWLAEELIQVSVLPGSSSTSESESGEVDESLSTARFEFIFSR